MPNCLNIISPGTYSSIQDIGRSGYRIHGVPESGVMDRYSAGLANCLLKNDPDAAVIEMISSGGKYQFMCATQFVLSGADFSPTLNGIALKQNKVYHSREEHLLEFGQPKFGNCCYLAVKGGIRSRVILGSRSEMEGVTIYPRLIKGRNIDMLSYPELTADTHSNVRLDISHFSGDEIEVMPGPEFERHFEAIQKFHFTIANATNRMAIQLNEDTRIKSSKKQMLTSSVLPGTIQLTPSGHLYLLMRDCQTTGGYPRIFQMTDKAINRLAQKRVGERVKFSLIA